MVWRSRAVPVLTGMALQFTVMPTCGWLVSTMLGLPPALAVGLILVSCCPGGAASNVVTHVARGNVTLSVRRRATIVATQNPHPGGKLLDCTVPPAPVVSSPVGRL